jgi:hypothetical protein
MHIRQELRTAERKSLSVHPGTNGPVSGACRPTFSKRKQSNTGQSWIDGTVAATALLR